MPIDDLWFLASRAEQTAEQTYHRLGDRYEVPVEFERTHRVSRRRFRDLARRVASCGAPFGVQTAVRGPEDALLLVRHEGADMWVLPGGDVDGDESPRETARRELREEAGIAAEYAGLAWLTRVRFEHDHRSTWGVLPVFEAEPAVDADPEARDPDGEISAARWFSDLPEDTRDRADICTWRARSQG